MMAAGSQTDNTQPKPCWPAIALAWAVLTVWCSVLLGLYFMGRV